MCRIKQQTLWYFGGARISGVVQSESKYRHAHTAITHLIGANPVSTPRQALQMPL